MSSSISTTSTPSTTNVATPIAFDDFDLLKDDVARLSFFDKKKLARRLGVNVANTSTWAEIGPITLRRLKRWRNLATPTRDEKQKKLEELAQRKRKRDAEATLDRNLLKELIGDSNGSSQSEDDIINRRSAVNMIKDGSSRNNSNSSDVGSMEDDAQSNHADTGTLDNLHILSLLIKEGKGSSGRKVAAGKKKFQSMRALLQRSFTRILPVQIAEAVWDFDIAKLIRFAVIMLPAVHRSYVSQRRLADLHRSKKDRSKDILAELIDAQHEEDESAEAVVAESRSLGVMQYAMVISRYVIPIVQVAWDPLLRSPLSVKLAKFMRDLEQDPITDTPGWKDIVADMWNELSIKLVSISADFLAVRNELSNVDLLKGFRDKVSAKLLMMVSATSRKLRILEDSPSSREVKKRRYNDGSNSNSDNKSRNHSGGNKAADAVYEKLRSLFGEDTSFDKSFFQKFSRSKHGQGTCLIGCIDPKACRRGSSCGFSHDSDKCFPTGDKCILGTCNC